jgi:murein DD-endopeptidase MepM/ murein hydrolase activator NlpD
MSCNCPAPDKTPLWSPIPDYRQPTQIQAGENIDCYSKRAGSVSGLKNDNGSQIPDRIVNTSLTSDLNGVVNVTFALTPNSTRTATSWEIAVNGVSGTSPLIELTWNAVTGQLSGTVNPANANKQYTVLITANDNSGEIDAREFNFFPKIAAKDETIKFLFPLVGDGPAHIVCSFGPRTPPAFGASSMHNGVDIAMVDHSLGNIVAASDGVVVKAGPATGFGNWIVIEHRDAQDNLVATTVYGHMLAENIYVVVGQQVGAGQKIALEGDAGIGTGAHLHFELHRGTWRNPVDPTPYIDGIVSIAMNNDPSVESPDGVPAPTDFTNVTIANSGMTTGETQAYANGGSCPAVLTNDANTVNPIPPGSNIVGNPKTTGQETAPPGPATNVNANRSSCSTSGPQWSTSQVISMIQAACAGNPNLTAYDSQWIQTVASIESNYDPYAKNPTSSATGLYQFLDALAVKYYGIIGIPPTCLNRCNPTYATQAMIQFYLDEIKPYWANYVSSGKTTIADKSIIPTSWSSEYPNLNQGEFMYGLIHHDGVGNAVAGRDLGGVAYWRSQVGT